MAPPSAIAGWHPRRARRRRWPWHANGHGNGNGNGHHVDDLLDAVREVEVTRRLYRSGESEYLIDGQPAACATSTSC